MVLPIATLLVACVFAGSVYLFAKERTIWRLVQLSGAIFLIIVVLTHAAERFDVLPGIAWGEPHSAGHYLDLVSAILGCIFFAFGFGGDTVARLRQAGQGFLHG